MNAGQEQEFERLFAPEGKWSKLLKGSDGYLMSEWFKVTAAEGFYRILDVWKTHHHFEAFRSHHGEELKQFAEMVRAEGIVASEEPLGAYYDSDDLEDEGPLTPA